MRPTSLFYLPVLLLSLTVPAALSQENCPTNPRSFTDYSQREDGSCEGIKPRSNVNSGAIRLVSLATKPITRFSQNLVLRIPHRGNQTPTVTLSSIQGYERRGMPLIRRATTHNASFPTRVLTRSNVTAAALRGVAHYNNHYVPIQIGGKHSQYEIVLHANSRTRIDTFQIRRNGVVQYRTQGGRAFRTGELKFSWNGKRNGTTAPAGTYQIYYEATVERRGQGRRPQTDTITFSHNPQWLD
ncbi:MAG: hypothetical protein ACFCA4_10410 [Cyanophyceae cyanobacterium]